MKGSWQGSLGIAPAEGANPPPEAAPRHQGFGMRSIQPTVLLRARAIENGAYVLAPSQIGGPPGQPAFGRSMVIDPWGTVVAQAPDRVGIIRADIETDRVAAVRRQIPVLANWRPEVYGTGRAR